MKTKQVYYIIIVILIVIILWQMFYKNEHFKAEDSEQKDALKCSQKYLIPALAEWESAYKKHTNNQNILGFISNNVTCKNNFLNNNNLHLGKAQQELKTCLNSYTTCDSKCKKEMYNLQKQYRDIQNAVNNLNSPVIRNCII